jgi:hypothetical protein
MEIPSLTLIQQLRKLHSLTVLIHSHLSSHPEIISNNPYTLTYYNMSLSKTSDVISDIRQQLIDRSRNNSPQ